MTAPPRSRGTAALALMVLFYGLGLVAVVGLSLLGLLLVEQFPKMVDLESLAALGVAIAVCFIAAAVLAWSILPRWDRFEAPGPEVMRADEPDLFSLIDEVAAATGQKPPAHVYTMLEVNAFAAERGGIMGLGSRRVMGIGLPLMQLLSRAELRAVLAHEFGHFYAGDTKLGPFIYKTRGAILRTVINLSATAQTAERGRAASAAWALLILRAPFIWFGNAFMRASQVLSRQQEITADALACRVAGSAALAAALRKLPGGTVSFAAYMQDEVAPILVGGWRPPLAEGFGAFIQAPHVVGQMDSVRDAVQADETVDADDSHPPLGQRIRAAEAMAHAVPAPDSRPAIGLLGDVDALEARAIGEDWQGFPPIRWDETAAVHVARWREIVADAAAGLGTLRAEDLPSAIPAWRQLLATAQPDMKAHAPDIDVGHLTVWIRDRYLSALGLALMDRGYTVTTAPGQPVVLHPPDRDAAPLDLSLEVASYLDRATSAAAWAARMEELGLAGTLVFAPRAVSAS